MQNDNYIEFLSQPAPVSMADEWFKYAGIDNFWMQWRFEVVKRFQHLLPTKDEPTIEIGCGSGVFRQQLETELGYTVDGCDLNLNAIKMAKKGNGRLMIYDVFDENPALLSKYATAFIMDVVEHIEDDVAFLRAAVKHVRPGGIVVVNVPANMFLYSQFDVVAGHVRRHSKETMKKLLQNAGLEPLIITNWAGTMVPILMARKVMLKFKQGNEMKDGFKPPNQLTDSFLRALMQLELSLPFFPAFGTSVFAIAKVA